MLTFRGFTIRSRTTLTNAKTQIRSKRLQNYYDNWSAFALIFTVCTSKWGRIYSNKFVMKRNFFEAYRTYFGWLSHSRINSGRRYNFDRHTRRTNDACSTGSRRKIFRLRRLNGSTEYYWKIHSKRFVGFRVDHSNLLCNPFLIFSLYVLFCSSRFESSTYVQSIESKFNSNLDLTT